MNFFGRGTNTPPPTSGPYSRVPDSNSGYNTPTGIRAGTPRLPSAYNDPSSALFEKRPLERRPPPRAGNMCVLSVKPAACCSHAQYQLRGRTFTRRRSCTHQLLDCPPSGFPARPARTHQWPICTDRQVSHPILTIATLSDRHSRHDNTGKLQPGTIGASAMQRQWIGLSISGDTVTIDPFPFPPSPVAPAFLQAIDLEISFLRATQESNTQYSVEELAKHFARVYRDIMFSNEELIAFEFHGQNFRATLKNAVIVELADEQQRGRVSERPPEYYTRGILMERTEINMMKSANSALKLKTSTKK